MVTVKSSNPLLIKFQSKDIIDSIQSGCIWMNQLYVFQKMEAENNNHEIGDRKENMIYSKAYEFPDGTPCALQLTDDKKSNFVFCMFTPNISKGQYQFTQEQKDKMIGFGDTALLITDWKEFCTRIHNSIIGNKYELYHRAVKYYDEDNEIPIEIMDLLTDGLHNLPFVKRKRYSYQQEYRLSIRMDKTSKEYIKLNIGNIHDISTQIPADDLLKEGIDIID